MLAEKKMEMRLIKCSGDERKSLEREREKFREKKSLEREGRSVRKEIT